MVSLWASYYPVAQAEVRGWPIQLHSEPLVKVPTGRNAAFADDWESLINNLVHKYFDRFGSGSRPFLRGTNSWWLIYSVHTFLLMYSGLKRDQMQFPYFVGDTLTTIQCHELTFAILSDKHVAETRTRHFVCRATSCSAPLIRSTWLYFVHR